MKPAEVFGVVVRTVGLLVVVPSLGVLCFALLNLVLGGPASSGGLIIMGIPPLLFGRWLLRGAPALVTYAYPEERPASRPISQEAIQLEHDH